MLRASFLGYNGWLIETQGVRILIDPLLEEYFGNALLSGSRLKVLPPRLFAFDKFPPIDAVIISHEHSDHFDLRSFAMIDPDIPVYLSCRSSIAARTILREMDFPVRELEPGIMCHVGPLEVLPLSPDHFKMNNNDEWDCLGLFVREPFHGGALFTSMDVIPTGDMLQRIRKSIDTNYLLSFRDGNLNWTTYQNLEKVLFGSPNGQTCTESDEITNSLREDGILNIVPGQSLVVTGGQIVSTEKDILFLSSESLMFPKDSHRVTNVGGRYDPIIGQAELSDKALMELSGLLEEFAEYLYGGWLFRKFLSLSSDVLEGKKATLIILLIIDTDNEYVAFEYDLQACAFNSVTEDQPVAKYLCGIECWASDFLGVLRGDIEPRLLAMGHSRSWTSGQSAPDPLLGALFPFCHPLRRPQERLGMYRQINRTLIRDVKIKSRSKARTDFSVIQHRGM